MSRKQRRRQEKIARTETAKQSGNNPDYALQAAGQFFQSGQLDQAIKILEDAQSQNPKHFDVTHGLAIIHATRGNLDGALPLFEKAVSIRPGDGEAQFNLGRGLTETGRLDEAIAAYRRSLEINPNEEAPLINLGEVLKDVNDFDGAEECCRRALEIKPDNALIHINLGNVLVALGRLEEAVASYREALGLNPNLAEAHTNLGNAFKAMGQLEEAVASHHQALVLNPDYAEAQSNLGNALHDLERLDDAVASYQKALDNKPDHAKTHYNLGNVLRDLGRLEEAVGSYRRALEIDPDYNIAHYNLGLALLLKGDLKEGWINYHWRFWADEYGVPQRPFTQTPWSGEPLQGKTILVWGEQGVGEEILFAGMVPDLTDAGAKVIFETDGRLVPLYRRSFSDVQCVARETPPALETAGQDIDFQVPSGGLGRWLRPDFDAFPYRPSYLAADTDRRDVLREQYLEDGGDFLVGIAWVSKNPWIGRQKSMSLMDLQPLTKVPSVRLIDLQYGETEDERKAFEKETGVPIIHDEGVDQMKDLDAFAAQVAALDLVVTISNTTAHVAGALGIPTWVLLNTASLPCWMIDRNDSPWYSSVKLFRQKQPGDWAGVIERVVHELENYPKG